MTYSTLLLEKSDDVATVTLNRPDQLNAINAEMLHELDAVLRDLEADDKTRVIVLTGAGMGKEYVIVKDTPGFIVNRILLPALNEATFLVEEGVANPADVDKAVKLGLNWPMGPLALLDHIGLDTSLAVCELLFHETGDQKFRPSKLLKSMVTAKLLGRKTGKGFHDWTSHI
ncbi:MAG: 3-hydroxyacyl-CoA dehydrogenase family protein [archaeon]